MPTAIGHTQCGRSSHRVGCDWLALSKRKTERLNVKAEKFDSTSHDRSREALPLLSHYVTAIAPLPLGELRKAERGSTEERPGGRRSMKILNVRFMVNTYIIFQLMTNGDQFGRH